MTSYELRWYYWLRRELREELGIPIPVGRPRALTRAQELRVFEQIIATPMRRRGQVYLRLARELGVGVSTLQAITFEQVIAHGGQSLRTFHVEPENSLLGAACE